MPSVLVVMADLAPAPAAVLLDELSPEDLAIAERIHELPDLEPPAGWAERGDEAGPAERDGSSRR